MYAKDSDTAHDQSRQEQKVLTESHRDARPLVDVPSTLPLRFSAWDTLDVKISKPKFCKPRNDRFGKLQGGRGAFLKRRRARATVPEPSASDTVGGIRKQNECTFLFGHVQCHLGEPLIAVYRRVRVYLCVSGVTSIGNQVSESEIRLYSKPNDLFWQHRTHRCAQFICVVE